MMHKDSAGQSPEAAKGRGLAGDRRSPCLAAREARRSAFTLTEVLVVLAIVALLVTILLPSFHRAPEYAWAVVCANNLHQIHTGFGLSQQDDVQQGRRPQYPDEILWPHVPGKWVASWDVFRCPMEPQTWGVGGTMLFHSQDGFSTPFAPGPMCKVRIGPAPAIEERPAVPDGVTEYGFEDMAGGGDLDFDDCVCHIYERPERRGEVVFGTAGYKNSIETYGQVIQLPSLWGPIIPPIRFPIPDGRTNYGYNAKMAIPGSGASLVALDYSKAIANLPGEDVGVHLSRALRHFDKVNVLFQDGSVRRMSFGELDPTLRVNRDQWGNRLAGP